MISVAIDTDEYVLHHTRYAASPSRLIKEHEKLFNNQKSWYLYQLPYGNYKRKIGGYKKIHLFSHKKRKTVKIQFFVFFLRTDRYFLIRFFRIKSSYSVYWNWNFETFRKFIVHTGWQILRHLKKNDQFFALF